MKILHIIESISRGGAEIFCRELIKNQKELNNDICLISLFTGTDRVFEQDYIEKMRKINVRVYKLNFEYYKIIGIIKLRVLINDLKPDIINVHLQTVSFYTSFTFTNIPIVHTLHSTKIRYFIIQKIVSKFFIKHFIAISNEVALIFKQKFNIPDKKMTIINNGIELKKFKVQFNNNDIIKLITIGNLSEPKNYSMLIKVFYELKKQLNNKKVILNIIGEGKKRKKIEQLIRTFNLENEINLLGYRDDIVELLSESDIYIMTSSWEGLSIALLEALASGLPAIVTNVGSNKMLVKNNINGFIHEPDDIKGFVKSLIYIISNKNRIREMGMNSLKIASRFDIKNTAKQYIELYNKILTEKCI